MNTPNLRGVGVALVTPFTAENEIDFNGFEKIINYVIENGVDNIVVLGTTGESVTLTHEEKQQLITKAVSSARKRVPVIAGFGGYDTTSLINDLQSFDLSGVDAILSVSPAYNKPTQNGIYEHYKAIANSTELPIILYNVPSRTSSNIEVETVLRLAHDFENIIGIKEAGSDWAQISQLAKNKPDNFFLLSGSDELIVPQIALGFDGVISVITNATPLLFSSMVHKGLNGDFEGSRRIFFEMIEAIDMMVEQGNPAGVKCAMKHLGVCPEEYVRLPLIPVDEELRQRIGEKVKSLKSKLDALVQ